MSTVNIENMKAADFRKELPQIVSQLDAFRQGNKDEVPTDISLEDFVQNCYGLSLNDYYDKLEPCTTSLRCQIRASVGWFLKLSVVLSTWV